MTFTYDIQQANHFAKFQVSRTWFRITGENGQNIPLLQRLTSTIKYMLRDHLGHQWAAKETDMVHLGFAMPDCDFWFNKVGGERVTIQECLYGDGIQKILDFFMQKIQSNKNCVFEVGTLVKLYSIDLGNFVPVDA